MKGYGRAPTLVRVEFSRRQVLRLMFASAGAALLRFPYVRAAVAAGPASPGHSFLTPDERAILEAATARIVPTDDQPGARECGVIDYIDSMLSFMPGTDATCDRQVTAADLTATVLGLNGDGSGCAGGGDLDGNGIIDAADVALAEVASFRARPVFAGGPFSGRQPQPHFPTGNTACQVCHGVPAEQGVGAAGVATPPLVDNYPPDAFAEFLPLPRLRALSWRVRLLGAAAVPEVADNPLASELPEVDLRRKYRDGLGVLANISQQHFGKPFVQLSADEQSTVLNMADQDFVTLLTYHTVEGLLCAPEYGGNRNRLGWKLIRFDGDSQPLGYTIYDDALGDYRERPDRPNSGPNPDEDCSGFSRALNNFLGVISGAPQVQPGRRFSAPYCLDVPT